MTLNNDLDEIIEREYKKSFEILEEIIEDIKRKYGIDYKIPELEISGGSHSFAAGYSKSENKIIFSKKPLKWQ
jgi:transcriptional antiterminator